MTTSAVGMSTLVELGELIRTRPGLDASAAEVAGWYERKAAMLSHAASTGALDPDTATGWARDAHQHAATWLSTDRVERGWTA